MVIQTKKILPSLILVSIFLLFFFNLSFRAESFTFFFVIIILIFEINKTSFQTDDIFYPKYLLLTAFYFYCLAGILIIETNGMDGEGTSIPDYIIDKYIVSCLFGLVGLSLGFSTFGKKNVLKSFNWTRFNEHKVLRILLFFLIITLILNLEGILKKYNFLQVESYSDRALQYRLDRRESTGSGLYETFLVDTPVVLINFFFLRFFFLSKGRYLKYLYLIPFVFCILTALFSGFRSSVVTLFLPFLFFFHYQKRFLKLTLTKALFYIIMGGVVYVMINLLAVVRGSSDPFQMIELLVERVQIDGFAFLRIDKSGELETSVNFMRLILGIDRSETNITYGKSIVDEVLVFVPLYFFPNRPFSISENYVKTFYPYIHDMGGGLGQFCLLEGYWAFGNLGVLLTSFLFGCLLLWFYLKIKNTLTTNSIMILLYSQIFDKSVVEVVRGGYIGSIKASLICTIVIIIAIFISKYTFNENRLDSQL